MFCVVLITCPPEKAEEIARTMLKKRVAACANTISQISSLYWWKNEIGSTEEALLVVKSRIDRLEDLKNCVKEVHPYDIPEVIALPIVTGHREYLEWVDKEVTRTNA